MEVSLIDAEIFKYTYLNSRHSVEKANILAEIFSKNSSLPESGQPLPFTPWASCTMPEVHIRTREVKRVPANLDIKKSSGPDGISAGVFKLCSSPLAASQFVLHFV